MSLVLVDRSRALTLSPEFIFSLVIQILTAGIFIGGSIMWQKFIEKQLARIEEKQDKYNNYLERLVKIEQSGASAHYRIDEICKRFEKC